jgi:hypothetical protein
MRFNFGIKSLFVLTLVVALLSILISRGASLILGLVGVLLSMNLAVAIAAIVLTKAMGFPTQGDHRDLEFINKASRKKGNGELVRPNHPRSGRRAIKRIQPCRNVWTMDGELQRFDGFPKHSLFVRQRQPGIAQITK